MNYIAFILQCQMSKTPQNLVKRPETRVIPILFNPLSRPHYTVTVSYHLLYTNQVPGDNYLYTNTIGRIKQKSICIPLISVKQMFNNCRII